MMQTSVFSSSSSSSSLPSSSSSSSSAAAAACANQYQSAVINETTNNRIYDRNLPSQVLQQYVSVRPVMTKYSYFPIVDPRTAADVAMEQQPTYNQHTMFNPGQEAPWSGFASNINRESELRNQVFALQKCDQAAYVPNSHSDLYVTRAVGYQAPLGSHELLFAESNFSPFNPNPAPGKVGGGLFQNSTRVQVRDLTKRC